VCAKGKGKDAAVGDRKLGKNVEGSVTRKKGGKIPVLERKKEQTSGGPTKVWQNGGG